MKALSLLLAITASALTAVHAGTVVDKAVFARHSQLAHRSENDNPLAARASKRCPNRVRTGSGTSSSSAPSNTHHAVASPTGNNGGGGSGGGGGGGGGNTIHVQSSCGPSGATSGVTATTGPNGALWWLNCGIDGGGWNPPHVRVSDLVVKELRQAVSQSSSPFKACTDFIELFERHAHEFGLPPILLASFAMQESSCRPHTVGGAGEQGLMQLTVDKCGGAPNGNCQDPNFNIRTAARYFSQTLNNVGGNVVQAVGTYNGFHPGLTHQQATAAANGPCCRCQNNLDYLHQFFNGWCQNIDAYAHSPRLGQYFNLDRC